jgi:hypothetical protein
MLPTKLLPEKKNGLPHVPGLASHRQRGHWGRAGTSAVGTGCGTGAGARRGSEVVDATHEAEVGDKGWERGGTGLPVFMRLRASDVRPIAGSTGRRQSEVARDGASRSAKLHG